jgi:phosphatidylglycerophosphatase A
VKRSPGVPTPWSVRLGATVLCVGEAAPAAPATAVSLLMVPVAGVVARWPLVAEAALLAGALAFAIWMSHRAEAHYGHDAKAITIDEVVGMLVTFLGVGLPEAGAARWGALIAGFFLFRVMDIVKPFPAGRSQRLPGGWGVVADDVLAGVYANLGLRLALRWF